jgi:phytoene/squalene synthetase
VDDRVDAARVAPVFTSGARRREQGVVRAWSGVVGLILAGRSPSSRELAGTQHALAAELSDALLCASRAFRIPSVLWSNFFAAMRRDLEERPFTRFEEFIEYTEGAAVAPTTIYLYLIAAERGRDDGAHRVPSEFDLITLGRGLGRFAYVAHILRDLREDLAEGEGALSCLAADDMARHGVSKSQLLADLDSGRASPPVRGLVRELVERAWVFSRRARDDMRALEKTLSVDRAFVLELIVRTYEEVLRKIAANSYDPMADAHRLTETDKTRIIREVASQWY